MTNQIEASDEPRYLHAEECVCRGFVDLGGVVGHPDVVTEVPIHHGDPRVEVGLLDLHICHMTPCPAGVSGHAG